MSIDPIKTRDNKYTFTILPAGEIQIDRYDLKEWVIIHGGCKAIGSLLYEIEELRANMASPSFTPGVTPVLDAAFNHGIVEGEKRASDATRACSTCGDAVVGGPTIHVGCVKLAEALRDAIAGSAHSSSCRCKFCGWQRGKLFEKSDELAFAATSIVRSSEQQFHFKIEIRSVLDSIAAAPQRATKILQDAIAKACEEIKSYGILPDKKPWVDDSDPQVAMLEVLGPQCDGFYWQEARQHRCNPDVGCGGYGCPITTRSVR